MQSESAGRRREYPGGLARQVEALRADPQLVAFRRLRSGTDRRHAPTFHFTAPEGVLNDPNGLCRWHGRYHLFYQASPSANPRQHWGHAVSDDLVNWRDLPLALYPGPELRVFSGSTFVESDRVIAMYHGTGVGNMIATAHDPLLLNWTKSAANPVIPLSPPSSDGLPFRVFDPFLWKEADGYYALSGTYFGPDGARFTGEHNRMVEHVFFSPDLEQWDYLGPLIDDNPFVEIGNDGACPYFWPIGDRHVLFFFSHRSGPAALLGDYDAARHRFAPTSKVQFSHGPVGRSSLHAPSAFPDGSGGVYLIFNIKDANDALTRNGAMTQTIHCTLERNELRFRPVVGMAALRATHESIRDLPLPAHRPHAIATRSSTFELNVELEFGDARAIVVRVLASDDHREFTSITVYRHDVARDERHWSEYSLSIDTTFASLSPDAQGRMPETCALPQVEGESVELRIFVDEVMIEVFANSRRFLAQMAYPTLADSTGITLTSLGGNAVARSLDAYELTDVDHDIAALFPDDWR